MRCPVRFGDQFRGEFLGIGIQIGADLRSMGFKICMNSSCGTSRTSEWKKGWPLRSGGYADLCYPCGSAYEGSVFCDTFHSEESGWRECCICSRRLHCGCVASSSLLQLLEYGGVGCASCTKSSGLLSVRKFGTPGDEIANGFGALSINGGCCAVESRLSEKNPRGEDFVDLCSMLYTQPRGLIHNLLTQPVKSVRKEMGEKIMHTKGEMGATFQNVTQPHVGPALFTKIDNARPLLDIRDMNDPLTQSSVSMTLGEPPSKAKFELPYTNGIADGRDQSKILPQFQEGQRSRDRPIVPKLPKNGQTLSSESNKTTTPQARVARPPAEGRGKNHLLPRYWPRITDQELQQLSGDLKSTIVPLFEKVLSASDAGRIGRLVLPKACAEAYFPPISQSEGLPLRIQDVMGNEWTFQFRFWPNNNSRMYVLEGVIPCIQTMQLRAGDTVTFSRIDPGGKLVMGFRKATNSDTQDTETSALNNDIPPEVFSNTSFTENQPSAGTNSGLHLPPKGNKDRHLDSPSENINLPDGDIGEIYRSKGNEASMQQQGINSEKKRSRNIGKNKRLLIHNEDALELRLTWEEAQDLLRPPPSIKPTVVTIEDHEFEEYDEPPVFGKRTIYTARSSGGEEQWAQCDDCSKWRRLPGNVLLPPKWICADNVWDSTRCSCSADAEISPKELENLLRVRRDSKKRRVVEAQKLAHKHEPSGLDALASAAALGEKLGEPGESSVGATTKHPRHRPGCSCIVCIQPPSGKGKHKPTCTCNVCMTVKRRFKTLMLRKKRRQSEREAELAGLARKESDGNKDAVQTNGVRNGCLENEGSDGRTQAEVAEINSGHIDLNCQPVREDMQVKKVRVSMTSTPLVETGKALQMDHMKHNGEVDGYREQEDTQHPELLSQSTHQDRHISDHEKFLASLGWEQKTAEN